MRFTTKTMNFTPIEIEDSPPIVLAGGGNSFLTNNATFVLGYELELCEIYTLGREDFDLINSIWQRALKGLPSGTIVHKQDYFFEKPFRGVFSSEHFLQKATCKHFEGRPFLFHKSLLFFSSPKLSTLENVKIKFALKKIDLGKVKEEEDFISYDFSNEVAKATTYLSKSNFFKVRPLSEEEVFYYSKVNLNLQEDKTTTGVFNKKGKAEKGKPNISLQVGENLVGIYGLIHERNFPSTLSSKVIDREYSSNDFKFFKGLGDHFGLYLPFSHIYNQIIYIDDSKYWIKALEKQKEHLKAMRGFSPQIKMQYQVFEQMLVEIYKMDEDLQFVRAHFNVVFWYPHRETFEKYSNQISSAFKSLDLEPHFFREKELAHLYFNSHFGCCSNFSNHHLALIPLNTSLCFLTNVTSYKSDPKGLVFNDRLSSIPICKDVWDAKKKRIKARNFAIFAPTGEGKSVLANHLIRQFIDQGYTVVIVDLGGSYEKLCHLYPKQSIYYKFEGGEPLTYNPFFLKNLSELEVQKIETLSEFIWIHIKREGLPSELERVSLRKIISFYYEQLSDLGEGHFRDFVAFVNKKKDSLRERLDLREAYFDFEAFRHLSSEFLEGGNYAFLYQKPAKESEGFDFRDKSLIVVDLDAIKENRFLLSIYLSMINDVTYTNIWVDRTKKGIVLYDEFAKQLQFEEVLNRVIYYAQAIRKQNGALGIILQSINQLPDKVEVRAMMENIQVIYSLRNSKGYKALVERLNLSTHQHYQLNSLQNNFSGERPYSEFWMLLGNESNVYRLELPPKVLYAYLTEGKENEEIMDLYKQSGDMEKAIEKYENQKK